MEIIIVILAVLAAAGIGAAILLILKSRNDAAQDQSAREGSRGMNNQADEGSRQLLWAPQDEALTRRTEPESEMKDKRQ